jgi:hypothetical protein
MPEPPNGKSIEEMYWDHVRAMSPAERMRKTLNLNAGVRAMVVTQIRKLQPDIDDRSLKFAVARRFYWNEPKVLQMLDEAEKSEKESMHE